MLTVARLTRLNTGRGAGAILRTPLGRRVLATNILTAFGVIAAVAGFVRAVFGVFLPYPAADFAVGLAICVVWGYARSHPRFHLRHRLKAMDVTVSVVIGDLLEQDTHIAVGFCDTFDTSVADDRIIRHDSLQGQFLHRVYDDDQQRLDKDLAYALRDIAPVGTESRARKRYGKLLRYPVGTVAVLGEPRRLTFAVAYGRMDNDLMVRAPVEELWYCFHQVWETVYRKGQREALSVPVMGSGLARVDALDRENLLRLILLSFAAYSRQRIACRDLRIVIRPGDLDQVDLVSIRAFLQAL